MYRIEESSTFFPLEKDNKREEEKTREWAAIFHAKNGKYNFYECSSLARSTLSFFFFIFTPSWRQSGKRLIQE